MAENAGRIFAWQYVCVRAHTHVDEDTPRCSV